MCVKLISFFYAIWKMLDRKKTMDCDKGTSRREKMSRLAVASATFVVGLNLNRALDRTFQVLFGSEDTLGGIWLGTILTTVTVLFAYYIMLSI